MINPAVPLNEKLRLESLKDLDIVDSFAEETYDSITKLASHICKTPVAIINIVDSERNWFKSKIGTDMTESSRELSFCGHTILEPNKLFEVPNTLKDKRFDNNPFAIAQDGGIRFYAGVPLLDDKGLAMGTLCVLDSKENHLSKSQKSALKALAKQVELLFEYRRKNKALEKIKNELDENNIVLREFASTVSHDLKMPLANMILTADILKAKYGNLLDDEGVEYLSYLKQSGLTLSDYISGLLDHYSSGNLKAVQTDTFFLNDLLEDIIDLLQIDENCEINLPDDNIEIQGNSAALGQIFMNLISNSLKYNDNEQIIINISSSKNNEFFNFSITDNGIGIPKDRQDHVYDLFTVIANKDRQGKKGHGIGLSTVKKIVASLGGTISLKSIEGKGATFNFNIRRPLTVD